MRAGTVAVTMSLTVMASIPVLAASPPSPCGAVLTLAEAAAYLRIDQKLLSDAARRGEVPGRRIGGQWRFSQNGLAAWLAGSDSPVACPDVPAGEAVKSRPPATPLTPAEHAAVIGAGMTATAQADAPQGKTDEQRFGQEPKEETARDVALREQTVLLGAGEAAFEVGLFYTRQDRSVLSAQTATSGQGMAAVPVVGSLQHDVYTGLVTGRYGVINDLELVASLSYLSSTREISPSITPTRSSENRFGDLYLSTRYAPVHEQASWPSVIVSVDGRVPTDNAGSYALGGGISLVKSLDPAAVFAGFTYTHAFDLRSLPEVTGQPANILTASLGLAFAMNDQLSVGGAVTGSFDLGGGDEDTGSSGQNFALRFNVTWLLTEGIFLEPSVSFGLNGPGDNVAFGLSMPFSF
jgi:excisionase family DNA binding protein